MAKEFKEFDKRYAKLAGTALKTIESLGGRVAKEDIQAMTQWPWVDSFKEGYSQGTVSYAVYHTPDALEWQKFRVSLKGLNTYEKLYALMWYWDTHVEAANNMTMTQIQNVYHQTVRVNNYLGALKRSGHLNSELRVVKA